MIGVLDVKTRAMRWLPFTANSSSPAWTGAGLYYLTNGGALRESAIDGSNARTIVAKADGNPIPSPDGRRIAFLSNDMGGDQLFVANGDGSAPKDVSQLGGVDVQSVAWVPGGRLIFTALGRPNPVHTDLGQSLALAALIIQSIVLSAGALLLVRRWRMPPGSLTFLLTLFALAMAVQTDFYMFAIGAFVTGVLADAAVFIVKDRIRSGRAFYALGLLMPLIFTVLFQIAAVQTFHGSAWAWNLLLGAPLLSGAAGLLVAFCFDAPLATEPAAT